MNLPFFVARRYLFSKKSHNAINLITWISILGMAVGTAALLIVLSVFNGLSGFIEGLFSGFDPDLKIQAAQGQFFDEDAEFVEWLRQQPGVYEVTRSIEAEVGLEYVDNQTFGVLKGIEPNFVRVSPLDTFVYEGNYDFSLRHGVPQALFGSLVAYHLSTNIYDETRPINLLYIPGDAPLTGLSLPIRETTIFPSGYFSIQKEYDEQYVIADFEFVRKFIGKESSLSFYEVALTDRRFDRALKAACEAKLGPAFEVLTWREQHMTLYRVMRNEKYFSYLILVLMLTIAAINIVGSLSMIVIEKTRDIAILKSMGAQNRTIRRVFLLDGSLVGVIGVGSGMATALIFYLFQERFGFLQLQGGESFRVSAFPMELMGSDFVLVGATVLLLSVLASVYPARKASGVEIARGLRM